MAAKNNDIPSVPVPPTASGVPPVEPPPAPPVAPAASTPPAPVAPPAPPRADPYAPPGDVVTPPPGYSAPGTGYAPPVAYGTPGGYAAPPANGLSIASMITGIVGVLASFVGFGFLPALAGVILGHVAQRRQPYAKPFWLTGIITGYVGVGISLLTGLAVVLFFFAGMAGAGYLG